MDSLKLATPYPDELDQIEDEPTDGDDMKDMPDLVRHYGLKACKTREDMLTALGNWYRATEARIAGFDAQWRPILDAYEADRKRLTNKLEFISKCLPMYLSEGEEFINESVDIRSKSSQSVEVEDLEVLPIEFCRVKTEADKTAIKAAIEAGQGVPGAKLKTNYSIKIKEGGIRAIENAKKRMKKLEDKSNE